MEFVNSIYRPTLIILPYPPWLIRQIYYWPKKKAFYLWANPLKKTPIFLPFAGPKI